MSFDTGLLAKVIVDAIYPKNKENYDENETQRQGLYVLSLIFSFLVGLLALWLSWQCNSILGYHWLIKILYGAGAFFFGLVYIVLYILLRWDVCMVLKYKNKRRR